MYYILLAIPVLIYVGASLWANFDLFPEDFMQYWWFDDLGHIVVFGSLALVALIISHRRSIQPWQAVGAISLLAVVDEVSQLVIPARAFDLHDLVMSLVGIGLAYIFIS